MGSVKDEARLPKTVRCPKCRTVFVHESTDDREDAADAESPTPGDSQAKPWYKDPILQFAMAFPLIAALAMGVYFFREWARTRFQEVMVTLKASADRAQTSGKIRDAYDLYASLVARSQGSSDEKVVEVAGQAKIERDKLFPQVKAQIERELAERERKEVDARYRADLVAFQEAEAKTLIEVRQRREAEVARLAQFTVDLKGGAWVIKGGGQSDILRGLNIYVIKQEVLTADLHEVLAKIRNHPYLSELGSDIRNLPNYPGDRVVELEKLYHAIRFAVSGMSDKIKMIHREYDALWLGIFTTALVAEATTNIDGKYEIKGLKGGHYLIYANATTRFYDIEWLIPLNIEKSGEVNKDLFNETAAQILNKDD
jgi:hypothetical protein